MGASHSIPPPPVYSVEVPGTGDADSTPHRRHVKFPDALETTCYEGMLTLYDSFQRGMSESGDGPCLGYRPVVDGVAGDYEWFTYKEIWTRVKNFGAGLTNLKLVNKNDDGLALLAHFSKNRMEWNISEHACNAFGFIVCPMYDTLGPETVVYVLNQTKLETVLISQDEFEKIIPAAKSCESLKNLIIMNEPTDEMRDQAKAAGLTLYSMSEVEKSGEESPVEPKPPKPEDIATFCYTSGTTGDPKAVITTHANFIACMTGAYHSGIACMKSDVHLSYLPLAHLMERVVQVAIISAGGAIGYYQGDTRKLMADIAALKPTIFPSVPRLYNKIYDKITQGVSHGLKKTLYTNGMDSKSYWLARGWKDNAVWDGILFNKIKAKVGLGRVRMMITGSAPIADHVMAFLRCVFSCEVIEGYGQTETTAASTTTFMGDYTTGHVGGPMCCNEIKLVSVPDMNYLVTDKFHGKDEKAGKAGIPCLGRGEICMRGPNIFSGYYNNDAKTKETVIDGWNMSGDIGIWLPNGCLKIVDRKKNIFKLSQGEYIAAEKIEIVYQKSPFVAQPFVYGDSLQSCLVGVIVPDVEYINSWAPANGFPKDMKELCANSDFKKIVMDDMKRVAKEAKLYSFEQCKDIHLESELWDAENLLTPTFKLKRNVAKKHYLEVIAEMYKKVGGITKDGEK